jgi:hypothetical protein
LTVLPPGRISPVASAENVASDVVAYGEILLAAERVGLKPTMKECEEIVGLIVFQSVKKQH